MHSSNNTEQVVLLGILRYKFVMNIIGGETWRKIFSSKKVKEKTSEQIRLN